ncbi:hypothetical protein D3C80_1212000 [compost metagenome]
MLEVGGEGALLDLLLVQVLPAEIIFTADPAQLLAIQGRYAVVGQIVVHLVEGAQGQACGLAETQAQGRRKPPAFAVDLFAPGHIVLVAHEVDPERAVLAYAFERLVAVQGHAVVVVGTDTAPQASKRPVLWLLADDVDAAAGGACTTEHRVGSFDDFDLLDVEGVGAVGLGAVAQAVDLDVAVGREAADVDAVARTATAFTGVEGDAGDVGQHLAQAQRLLLLDHLGGHHGNGLRGVEQRCGVFARGRAFGLVVAAGLGINVDVTQLKRRAGSLLCERAARCRSDGQAQC